MINKGIVSLTPSNLLNIDTIKLSIYVTLKYSGKT